MTVPAEYSVLGHLFSKAEFELLLEAAKALVFGAVGAGIGAYFVFRLDQRAKARERDEALYNDLIKPRILAVNDLNAELTALGVEYFKVLDAFDKQPPSLDELLGSPPDYEVGRLRRKTAEREISNEAALAVLHFLKGLPSHAKELAGKADKVRYTVGARQIEEFRHRIDALVREIEYVWNYMFGTKATQIVAMTPIDKDKAKTVDYGSAVTDQLHRAYKSCARLSRRRIEQFLSNLSSEYETVLRTKGLSTLDLTPSEVRSTMERLARLSQGLDKLNADSLEREIERENQRSETGE